MSGCEENSHSRHRNTMSDLLERLPTELIVSDHSIISSAELDPTLPIEISIPKNSLYWKQSFGAVKTRGRNRDILFSVYRTENVSEVREDVIQDKGWAITTRPEYAGYNGYIAESGSVHLFSNGVRFAVCHPPVGDGQYVCERQNRAREIVVTYQVDLDDLKQIDEIDVDLSRLFETWGFGSTN